MTSYVLESIAEPGDNLLLTLTTVKPFPFLIILEIARLWLSSTASLFLLVTLSKPQSHKKILDAGEILPFQQETWPNLLFWWIRVVANVFCQPTTASSKARFYWPGSIKSLVVRMKEKKNIYIPFLCVFLCSQQQKKLSHMICWVFTLTEDWKSWLELFSMSCYSYIRRNICMGKYHNSLYQVPNSWSHKEHNPSPSQLLLTRFHAFRILESIVSETIWPFSIALQKKTSLQFKFWIPFSLLKFGKFAKRWLNKKLD